MLEGNKNKKLYKVATINPILDRLEKGYFDYKLVSGNFETSRI